MSFFIFPWKFICLLQAVLSISFTLFISACSLFKSFCISYSYFLSFSYSFTTAAIDAFLFQTPAASCSFFTTCLFMMRLLSLLEKQENRLSAMFSNISTPIYLHRYVPYRVLQAWRWIKRRVKERVVNLRQPSAIIGVRMQSQGILPTIFSFYINPRLHVGHYYLTLIIYDPVFTFIVVAITYNMLVKMKKADLDKKQQQNEDKNQIFPITLQHRIPCWPHVFYEFKEINGSVFAQQDIPSRSLLMQIPYSKTLSSTNLPSIFDEFSTLSQEQKTILYLMSMKKNIEKIRNPNIQQWISRKTHGFTQFPEQIIKASNDMQLQKQYKMYKKHIKEQIQSIRSAQYFRKITQILAIEEPAEEFQALFNWAYQFNATRCFGHTEDFMLIPFFDYINYDPSTFSNVDFITYDSQQEFNTIIKNMFCTEQQYNQFIAKCEEENQENFINQSQSHEQFISEQNHQSGSDNQNGLIKPGAITKKYLAMISTSRIKKNKQLLFDYGKLGNYSLLMHYGYCVKNNSENKLNIFIKNSIEGRRVYYHRVQGQEVRRFQIGLDEICAKLLKFWAKIHRKKIIQVLPRLILQLKDNAPPQMNEKDYEQMVKKWGKETQFLRIYQEQNLKIYLNQIKLMERYLQNQAKTWEYFYLEG